MGATRLIGVIGSESNRELAQRIGYTDIFTAVELKAFWAEAAKDKLDVVFDTVGGERRGHRPSGAPLAEAAQVHRLMEARKVAGKVVLRIPE
jgi:NADPH:quinone reductase-like Zn-dependent oxidoreductase